jgi:AraC-like DNA-binding protein
MTTPSGQPVAARPDPRLRSVVAADYTGWTRRADRADRFVVPAHLSVLLILKIEDSAIRPPEFVHGAAAAPTVCDGGCAPRYLQIDLTPLGAYRAFGVPMHQLSGQLVDLADLLGHESRKFTGAVRDAATWPERFAAVDRFLLGRLQEARAVDGRVAFAWQRLVSSGGAAPIRDISRETGWSHKHLITRFREQVGLTPKRAARVLRFERVLHHLDGGPPPDWARLAAKVGYADQAHLIRDFAEVAGTTPAAGDRPAPR